MVLRNGNAKFTKHLQWVYGEVSIAFKKNGLELDTNFKDLTFEMLQIFIESTTFKGLHRMIDPCMLFEFLSNLQLQK
jgi:hypothetical protein